jgi:hypothetical protein
MSAYNNIDTAIAGLKADNNDVTRVISRAIQDSGGISFGASVWGYLGEEDKCYGFYLDTAKIVFDADFVASNSIVITVDGTAADAVSFDTDHDTTMDALITELTGEGWDASLDATDTDNRTIYIRKSKGSAVGTVSEAVTGGGSQPTGTITYETSQVFLGVAMYTAKNVDSSGTGKYEQYDSVSIVNRGTIWATITGTVNAEDDAYIETTNGTFDDTAGLTVSCKFKSNDYDNPTTSDKLAIIECNGSYKPYTERAWA